MPIKNNSRTSAKKQQPLERLQATAVLKLSRAHQCKRCAFLLTLSSLFLLTALVKVLERDEKAQEKAPKVFQDQADPSKPKGTRSYSTAARRSAQIQAMNNPVSLESQPPGHIFGLPELPLPSTAHIKHRYDPVIKQVTNLLMQDGKLSVAQRVRPSVPLFLTHQLIVSSHIH